MAEEAVSTTPDAKPRSRYDIIADIVAGERFGPGERASLRRNDRSHVVGQPAFHRLLALQEIDVPYHEAPAWGTIVQAIAQTAANGHHLKTGTALAASGLSEARFVKLMAASGDALLDQVGIIARYLAAKQSAISWTDLADLLLADANGNDERASDKRFRIAKHYYRELHKLDQQKSA